jgi:hypothetical protein
MGFASMGSGSASLQEAVDAASPKELKEAMVELPACERARLSHAVTAAYPPSTSSLITDDVVFGARAPCHSIAEAMMPLSMMPECDRKNSIFMLGPSHLDSNLCHIHGIAPKFEDERGKHFSCFLQPEDTLMEPTWATPVDVVGYAGLPVHNRFTLEMLKRAYTTYGQRVVWMVPDFRFNNSNLPELQQKRAAKMQGDDLFLDVGFGPANIHASFMTASNDKFLLEYGLDCLDHIIETLPNVKLLFWCAFFRTYEDDASTQGIYKDLYSTLVYRYPRNILDIRSYISLDDVLATRAKGKFWRDKSGHPSPEGYRLIHQMALALASFPTSPMKKRQLVLPEEGEEEDGRHAYFIVGTWSQMKSERMLEHPNGDYTFDVTMGANSWEGFYILQNNNRSKKICPAHPWANKHQRCIGPQDTPETCWLLDARKPADQDSSDIGNPGDKYRIQFSSKEGNLLQWSKISNAQTAYADDGSYFALASWKCWGLMKLEPVSASPGTFSLHAQMTKLNLKFQLLRNADVQQYIYPDCKPGTTGTNESDVLGVGASAEDVAETKFNNGRGVNWMIDGKLGDVFKISFRRNPHDLACLSVWWEFVENKPVMDFADRYFVCGSMNRWGQSDKVFEMRYDESEGGFIVDLRITQIPMVFYLMENNIAEMVIQPDKKLCTQNQSHNVIGPHAEIVNRKQEKLTWAIGKSEEDEARMGDIFQIKFELAPTRRVTWTKK